MRKFFIGVLLILVFSGCSLKGEHTETENVDKIHFTVTNGSINQFGGTNKEISDPQTISKVQDMINELKINNNKIDDRVGLVGANTYTLELIDNGKVIKTYIFFGNSITVKADDGEIVYTVENTKIAKNLICKLKEASYSILSKSFFALI
ncbi:hypothetical protein [Enterococcus sp. OL5]|uniref:hypothetical protein n=1 Tax=Enterococcus sp. OL5 TaxID=2590214 RepID=UPI0011264698|nr:hypothetical protein [Enterococcus sp. OL5]TPR57237.1 hypothetical protein FJU10_08520 [Enterococcus sp. OL5]